MKDFNFNCPHCNQLLEASITMMGTIIDCPSCNNSIKIPGPEINYLLRTTEKFGPRQIIAIAGILLLIIGIFAPIAHIPVYGDINYFQNGNVDGIIIIVLAILSFVAIILKEDYLLFFTSLGCIGTLTFSFVRFKLMISKVAANNSENIFSELANLAVSTVQLQWGCAFLIIGSCLTITPLFLKLQLRDTQQQAYYALSLRWRIIAGLIIVSCLIAIIFSAIRWPVASNRLTRPSSLSCIKEQAAKTDKNEIATISIGDSIDIDDVKLTVRGVQIDNIRKKPLFGGTSTPSENKYLIIDISLQNVSPGKIIEAGSWTDATIKDNFDNFERAESFFLDVEGCFRGSLMPGKIEYCMIIFKLPLANAEAFTVKVSPSFYRKDESGSMVQSISSSQKLKIMFTRAQIRQK